MEGSPADKHDEDMLDINIEADSAAETQLGTAADVTFEKIGYRHFKDGNAAFEYYRYVRDTMTPVLDFNEVRIILKFKPHGTRQPLTCPARPPLQTLTFSNQIYAF